MNFLLSQAAKLSHAKFFKSAILIKTGDIFVKWTMRGKNYPKKTKKSIIKVLSRLAVLSALSGKG